MGSVRTRRKSITFGGTEGCGGFGIEVGTEEVEEGIDEEAPNSLVPLSANGTPHEADRASGPCNFPLIKQFG